MVGKDERGMPIEHDRRFILNVLETTPNILYIFDFSEMKDVYANNAFYKILGYSAEEIKSMGSKLYPNLLHPEDAEKVFERNQKMKGMKDGQVLEIEYRVKHRSGEWRWLHDRSTIFSRNKDGSVRTILGSAEDITDRKNMEDALRQSEARFHVALKNAPITVFNQDANLKYIWVHHPQTGIMTVIEPGKSDLELQNDMDISDFVAAKKSVMAEGLGIRKEIKIVKNGRQYFFDLTAEPLRDPEGNLLGITCAASEITENKKTQEALGRLVSHLKTLHDIDLAILSARSVERICSIAVKCLADILRTDRAGIILFNAAGKKGEVVALNTSLATGIGKGAKLSLGMFGDLGLFRTGRIRIFGNLPEISRLPEELEILQGEGICELLAVPIKCQKDLIGILELGWKEPGQATSEYLSYARNVADSLAVAIQHYQLFEQVRTVNKSLQAVSQQLIEAQEAERKHIARELHDEIGQALTALKINLEALSHPARDDWKKRLADSIQMTGFLLQQVRNLTLALRPALLEIMGLAGSIKWQLEKEGLRTGFQTAIQSDVVESEIPEHMKTILFRIAQEAITNICRHARAKKVRVELKQKKDKIQLTILDDGVGFRFRKPKHANEFSGMGLKGIQERALLVGGKSLIKSKLGMGTKLSIQIPISDSRQKAGPQ